jgi:hypothetical protein
MITIYQETLTMAVIDDQPDDDETVVESYIPNYINYIRSELQGKEMVATIEDEAPTPGPCFHSDTDEEHDALRNINSFWEWWN